MTHIEPDGTCPYMIENQRHIPPGGDWLTAKPLTIQHVGQRVYVVGEDGVWDFIGLSRNGDAVVRRPRPGGQVSTAEQVVVDPYRVRLIERPVTDWPPPSGRKPLCK